MRIVSLCPSLTETVFALGRGEALIGRTKFCIHPAEGVARVPRLGGTKNPQIERIVALRPDLVLMNQEENRREDAETLAAAGVATLSSFPRDAPSAAAAVRELGRALAANQAAEAIAAAILDRAARVSVRAATRARVRFAYLIWRAPWMSVSADTYVHGLLALAGGENVFAGRAERYPEVTTAELAAGAPERVLLSSEPYPFAAKHADELAAATKLARASIRLVDGELLSWHGARTPAGIDYADALMAPEAAQA